MNAIGAGNFLHFLGEARKASEVGRNGYLEVHSVTHVTELVTVLGGTVTQLSA